MANKSYTILLTSNSSTGVKSITVSKAWARAVIFVVLLFVLLLAAFFFDYVRVLSDLNQKNGLQSENNYLKRNYELLESKMSSLENALHRVEEYSAKIRAVVPKVGSPEEDKGGLSGHNHQDQEVAGHNSRAALASWAGLSSVASGLKFLKKAPLDHTKKNSDSDQGKVLKLTLKLEKMAGHSSLQEMKMSELWGRLSQKKFLLDATPSLKPVRGGWYTSKFGVRRDPFTGASVMHSGLDIAAAPGTPVYAPADGIVAYTSYESGYGNLVTIDHGFGVKTRYAHNSKVHVKRGQVVSRGDLISSVGSTGRSSGSHLHYEVRLNGVAVDPMNYISDLF